MSEADLNPQGDERVPVQVTVRISTIDPETDPTTGKPYFRTSEETCANVSRGGTFVVTRDPIAPGRRLLLEIDIPGGPPIQTIGRVAWTRTVIEPSGGSNGSGFGIEFMGGSPEHLSQLQAFVEHKHRRQHTPEEGGWRTPKASPREGD